MNEYDTYKQIKYLPYLKDLNKILTNEVQKVLTKIFSDEIIKILNLIINDFQTKMNTPIKDVEQFDEYIFFSTNYVKEQTGLSRQAQQSAIEILDKLSLITYDYPHESRCIYLNGKNFKHFYKQFIQKYIKVTSKSNYKLIELVDMYIKYIDYIWNHELDS